jgi:hypothetical protein
MLGKAAKEAAKYLRKLKKELKSRDKFKPEILRANDKIVTKKNPGRISEMTDKRLEQEKQLLNPNLTYEERVELLGGKYKKGGSVKKGYHKMPDGSVMKNSAHKMSCGGKVHKMKAGGKVRGDGICKKGKTRGRMV